MEQLLSTPLRPAEFLLGKLTAYFAVGMLDSFGHADGLRLTSR
jgi:ABC-2 type transport system permease protein